MGFKIRVLYECDEELKRILKYLQPLNGELKLAKTQTAEKYKRAYVTVKK